MTYKGLYKEFRSHHRARKFSSFFHISATPNAEIMK